MDIVSHSYLCCVSNMSDVYLSESRSDAVPVSTLKPVTFSHFQKHTLHRQWVPSDGYLYCDLLYCGTLFTNGRLQLVKWNSNADELLLWCLALFRLLLFFLFLYTSYTVHVIYKNIFVQFLNIFIVDAGTTGLAMFLVNSLSLSL